MEIRDFFSTPKDRLSIFVGFLVVSSVIFLSTRSYTLTTSSQKNDSKISQAILSPSPTASSTPTSTPTLTPTLTPIPHVSPAFSPSPSSTPTPSNTPTPTLFPSQVNDSIKKYSILAQDFIKKFHHGKRKEEHED